MTVKNPVRQSGNGLPRVRHLFELHHYHCCCCCYCCCWQSVEFYRPLLFVLSAAAWGRHTPIIALELSPFPLSRFSGPTMETWGDLATPLYLLLQGTRVGSKNICGGHWRHNGHKTRAQTHHSPLLLAPSKKGWKSIWTQDVENIYWHTLKHNI